MMAQMAQHFSDQLREAIRKSGHSRYAISKATGVYQSTLSRFMVGKSGLSVQNLDALCRFLQLDLQPRPKRRGKPKV
jgi:hypothetical protein